MGLVADQFRTIPDECNILSRYGDVRLIDLPRDDIDDVTAREHDIGAFLFFQQHVDHLPVLHGLFVILGLLHYFLLFLCADRVDDPHDGHI